MLGCPLPRYRLLDLVFAVCGTVAFLVDLGSDVWSAAWYYRAGDTVWAVLYVGLYLLSSSVLQVLSWGWFWVDWKDWNGKPREAPEPGNAGSGAIMENATGGAAGACGDHQTSNGGVMHSNGTKYQEDARQGTAASVMDAVPIDKAVSEISDLSCETPEPCTTQGCSGDIPLQDNRTSATLEEGAILCHGCTYHSAGGTEDQPLVKCFYTSKLILWPSCFTLLHILQLGYLLRCIHSLEVGIAAYRKPDDKQFKDYAYFLTHDISMMRLIETFLENTPQLILVLYIIVQKEAIETFQCFSISMSFICISWAILDYHQSLRLFLKGKLKLSNFSSAIYYLWNFCLISSRILCITLFTVTFHWLVALHFFLLWSVFFLWATLQKTTFMKHKCLEIVYRATVAFILYFSWFNIADGRTIYRCIVYMVFIVIDSVVLVVSWVKFKFPSILDGYEMHIIVTNMVFLAVGVLLRALYYKNLHPTVLKETKQYYDEPDGIGAKTNGRLLSAGKTGQPTNHRMKFLAEQIC
ncbi:XK-related protein 8 [Bufo gargarizans]|uniref:XK-related protein 8 n=1 Tax=Bufo gargarizans TaxID=30331 RepID=UPI001CF434E0|nr:XK-related protein 8 [Bufo gargarizans]